jgi:hypothetical protein
MKTAVILLIGASVYIWFLHIGDQVATHELNQVEKLYTSAYAQASTISVATR